MATPLKHIYNPSYFERLCPILKDAVPEFDAKDFIFRVFNNQWPDLELKDRAVHIANVLHHFLSKDFPTATQQILTISRALKSKFAHDQGWENIFLAVYINQFGRHYPEQSENALRELSASWPLLKTQRLGIPHLMKSF